MITIHKSDERGNSDLGWLQSRFSFSFSDYYNARRTGFGRLLVVNDDIIAPGKGFSSHSHNDMEIITIVTEGELEHKDSTGKTEVLVPGTVQVMSAGTGITHSEFNHSKTKQLKLFQIWIEPLHADNLPRHASKTYSVKKNELLLVASGSTSKNAPYIDQDAKIYVGEFDTAKAFIYKPGAGNGVFIMAVEGAAKVDGNEIKRRDSIEVSGKSKVKIDASKGTRLVIIEVPM